MVQYNKLHLASVYGEMVTKRKESIMKQWFKKMYIKWWLGQCRHLCCLCSYRNQCDDNFEP